ncbi:MAG: peptide chain release factor 1 [Alphaproteobacteria bacterium]
MSFEIKLRTISARYDELSVLLSEGTDSNSFVKMSKEFSEIEPIVQKFKEYEKIRADLEEMQTLADDASADSEMRNMAREEIRELSHKVEDIENELKFLLIPKDEADEKNALLEVRAGTGGEEAALFAAELFRMYERYAAVRGWKFETIEYSDTGIGGVKEAIGLVTGKNVFADLKFESGVHRVQRVPLTEANGRVHTSAATVAVMPEAEDVDVKIEDKDLRIDVFRASGAGGQHVNRTESAVRITHLPTGTVVQCQDGKSQHQNKEQAMKVLKSRIYDKELEEKNRERASQRKNQVGSGDRSERIRTYNFPQGRVTDHRINLTLYKIDEIMNGEGLGEVIQALIAEDRLSKLSEIE